MAKCRIASTALTRENATFVACKPLTIRYIQDSTVRYDTVHAVAFCLSLVRNVADTVHLEDFASITMLEAPGGATRKALCMDRILHTAPFGPKLAFEEQPGKL